MDAEPLGLMSAPVPTRVYVFGVVYFRRQEPLLVRIRDRNVQSAVSRVRQMYPQSQISLLDDQGHPHVVQRFQEQPPQQATLTQLD